MATYQFKSCCDSSDIFRVSGLTSLAIGDVYSGNTAYFSGGCAQIITDTSSGTLYDGALLTLIGPYDDCNQCVTCPSDTVCFTVKMETVGIGDLINVSIPPEGIYHGKNYYNIGSGIRYIFWNSGTTKWEQSNTLGGTVYNELDNDSNNLPISSVIYNWEIIIDASTLVIESYSGTCLDSYCTGDTYCINFNLPSYTGFNGTYTYAGTYNDGTYYTGDSLSESYIFRQDQRWCLSDTLGGTCVIAGYYPCTSVCPDLDPEILSEGFCIVPTTTIFCDTFDFEAFFDCDYIPPDTEMCFGFALESNGPGVAFEETLVAEDTFYNGKVWYNYNDQRYIYWSTGGTYTDEWVVSTTGLGALDLNIISNLDNNDNELPISSLLQNWNQVGGLINGQVYRSTLGPCIGPTPTPTPTFGPTPTPTPTSPCSVSVITANIIIPPPPTTASPLPPPNPLPIVSFNGIMNYPMFDGRFLCDKPNKLVECDTLKEYYVAECIIFNDNLVPFDTTLQVVINGVNTCVIYREGTSNSVNAILNSIVQIIPDCNSCVLPTPTPTPTSTLIGPTPTPTPTQAPIQPTNKTYIYSSCTTPNLTFKTDRPGSNENPGQIIGFVDPFAEIVIPVTECWKLIQIDNTWPSNTPTTYQVTNFFSGKNIKGVYDDCDDCLNPPTFDIIKGDLILETTLQIVPNSDYLLTINNSVVSTIISEVPGNFPTIKLSNINPSFYINAKFIKLEIFQVSNNALIYTRNISNQTTFTVVDFQMPPNNVRIQVTINATLPRP